MAKGDPFAAFSESLIGSAVCVCKAFSSLKNGNNDPRAIMERYFENKGMVIRKKDEIIEKPHIGKIIKTNYGWHIIFKLYPGLSRQNLNRMEIEYALNAETDLDVDPSGWVHIRAYTKRIPKVFPFRRQLAAEIKKYDCAIPIGIARQGYIILDMSLDENFALLIGGMPGFGKSRFLSQALTSVVLNYSPEQVQLWNTDMKNWVELKAFQNTPHLQDWAGNLQGAKRVLTKANTELDIRADKMGRIGVTNIKEYNEVAKTKLPHGIIVVDEYADLDDEAKSMVTRIARMGRFAGFHPIICTQRPSHTVLPGDTKALLPVTLCFRVRNPLNSTMILGKDMPHAAYIKGKGRAILMTHKIREVQVMDLSPRQREELLETRLPVQNNSYQLIPKKSVSW
jgi:S-DNA-T family DNA segregation ATPase FtsK/SpoIIIE